jgi:hypothetical protein
MQKETPLSKTLTTEERFARARILIQKAHEIPAPVDGGWDSLSYAAQVKDTLRQARDLLKFLPQTAGVTAQLKQEAVALMQEIVDEEKKILHKT